MGRGGERVLLDDNTGGGGGGVFLFPIIFGALNLDLNFFPF